MKLRVFIGFFALLVANPLLAAAPYCAPKSNIFEGMVGPVLQVISPTSNQSKPTPAKNINSAINPKTDKTIGFLVSHAEAVKTSTEVQDILSMSKIEDRFAGYLFLKYREGQGQKFEGLEVLEKDVDVLIQKIPRNDLGGILIELPIELLARAEQWDAESKNGAKLNDFSRFKKFQTSDDPFWEERFSVLKDNEKAKTDFRYALAHYLLLDPRFEFLGAEDKNGNLIEDSGDLQAIAYGIQFLNQLGAPSPTKGPQYYPMNDLIKLGYFVSSSFKNEFGIPQPTSQYDFEPLRLWLGKDRLSRLSIATLPDEMVNQHNYLEGMDGYLNKKVDKNNPFNTALNRDSLHGALYFGAPILRQIEVALDSPGARNFEAAKHGLSALDQEILRLQARFIKSYQGTPAIRVKNTEVPKVSTLFGSPYFYHSNSQSSDYNNYKLEDYLKENAKNFNGIKADSSDRVQRFHAVRALSLADELKNLPTQFKFDKEREMQAQVASPYAPLLNLSYENLLKLNLIKFYIPNFNVTSRPQEFLTKLSEQEEKLYLSLMEFDYAIQDVFGGAPPVIHFENNESLLKSITSLISELSLWKKRYPARSPLVSGFDGLSVDYLQIPDGKSKPSPLSLKDFYVQNTLQVNLPTLTKKYGGEVLLSELTKSRLDLDKNRDSLLEKLSKSFKEHGLNIEMSGQPSEIEAFKVAVQEYDLSDWTYAELEALNFLVDKFGWDSVYDYQKDDDGKPVQEDGLPIPVSLFNFLFHFKDHAYSNKKYENTAEFLKKVQKLAYAEGLALTLYGDRAKEVFGAEKPTIIQTTVALNTLQKVYEAVSGYTEQVFKHNKGNADGKMLAPFTEAFNQEVFQPFIASLIDLGVMTREDAKYWDHPHKTLENGMRSIGIGPERHLPMLLNESEQVSRYTYSLGVVSINPQTIKSEILIPKFEKLAQWFGGSHSKKGEIKFPKTFTSTQTKLGSGNRAYSSTETKTVMLSGPLNMIRSGRSNKREWVYDQAAQSLAQGSASNRYDQDYLEIVAGLIANQILSSLSIKSPKDLTWDIEVIKEKLHLSQDGNLFHLINALSSKDENNPVKWALREKMSPIVSWQSLVDKSKSPEDNFKLIKSTVLQFLESPISIEKIVESKKNDVVMASIKNDQKEAEKNFVAIQPHGGDVHFAKEKIVGHLETRSGVVAMGSTMARVFTKERLDELEREARKAFSQHVVQKDQLFQFAFLDPLKSDRGGINVAKDFADRLAAPLPKPLSEKISSEMVFFLNFSGLIEDASKLRQDLAKETSESNKESLKGRIKISEDRMARLAKTVGHPDMEWFVTDFNQATQVWYQSYQELSSSLNRESGLDHAHIRKMIDVLQSDPDFGNILLLGKKGIQLEEGGDYSLNLEKGEAKTIMDRMLWGQLWDQKDKKLIEKQIFMLRRFLNQSIALFPDTEGMPALSNVIIGMQLGDFVRTTAAAELPQTLVDPEKVNVKKIVVEKFDQIEKLMGKIGIHAGELSSVSSQEGIDLQRGLTLLHALFEWQRYHLVKVNLGEDFLDHEENMANIGDMNGDKKVAGRFPHIRSNEYVNPSLVYTPYWRDQNLAELKKWIQGIKSAEIKKAWEDFYKLYQESAKIKAPAQYKKLDESELEALRLKNLEGPSGPYAKIFGPIQSSVSALSWSEFYNSNDMAPMIIESPDTLELGSISDVVYRVSERILKPLNNIKDAGVKVYPEDPVEKQNFLKAFEGDLSPLYKDGSNFMKSWAPVQKAIEKRIQIASYLKKIKSRQKLKKSNKNEESADDLKLAELLNEVEFARPALEEAIHRLKSISKDPVVVGVFDRLSQFLSNPKVFQNTPLEQLQSLSGLLFTLDRMTLDQVLAVKDRRLASVFDQIPEFKKIGVGDLWRDLGFRREIELKASESPISLEDRLKTFTLILNFLNIKKSKSVEAKIPEESWVIITDISNHPTWQKLIALLKTSEAKGLAIDVPSVESQLRTRNEVVSTVNQLVSRSRSEWFNRFGNIYGKSWVSDIAYLQKPLAYLHQSTEQEEAKSFNYFALKKFDDFLNQDFAKADLQYSEEQRVLLEIFGPLGLGFSDPKTASLDNPFLWEAKKIVKEWKAVAVHQSFLEPHKNKFFGVINELLQNAKGKAVSFEQVWTDFLKTDIAGSCPYEEIYMLKTLLESYFNIMSSAFKLISRSSKSREPTNYEELFSKLRDLQVFADLQPDEVANALDEVWITRAGPIAKQVKARLAHKYTQDRPVWSMVSSTYYGILHFIQGSLFDPLAGVVYRAGEGLYVRSLLWNLGDKQAEREIRQWGGWSKDPTELSWRERQSMVNEQRVNEPGQAYAQLAWDAVTIAMFWSPIKYGGKIKPMMPLAPATGRFAGVRNSWRSLKEYLNRTPYHSGSFVGGGVQKLGSETVRDSMALRASAELLAKAERAALPQPRLLSSGWRALKWPVYRDETKRFLKGFGAFTVDTALFSAVISAPMAMLYPETYQNNGMKTFWSEVLSAALFMKGMGYVHQGLYAIGQKFPVAAYTNYYLSKGVLNYMGGQAVKPGLATFYAQHIEGRSYSKLPKDPSGFPLFEKDALGNLTPEGERQQKEFYQDYQDEQTSISHIAILAYMFVGGPLVNKVSKWTYQKAGDALSKKVSSPKTKEEEIQDQQELLIYKISDLYYKHRGDPVRLAEIKDQLINDRNGLVFQQAKLVVGPKIHAQSRELLKRDFEFAWNRGMQIGRLRTELVPAHRELAMATSAETPVIQYIEFARRVSDIARERGVTPQVAQEIAFGEIGVPEFLVATPGARALTAGISRQNPLFADFVLARLAELKQSNFARYEEIMHELTASNNGEAPLSIRPEQISRMREDLQLDILGTTNVIIPSGNSAIKVEAIYRQEWNAETQTPVLGAAPIGFMRTFLEHGKTQIEFSGMRQIFETDAIGPQAPVVTVNPDRSIVYSQGPRTVKIKFEGNSSEVRENGSEVRENDPVSWMISNASAAFETTVVADSVPLRRGTASNITDLSASDLRTTLASMGVRIVERSRGDDKAASEVLAPAAPVSEQRLRIPLGSRLWANMKNLRRDALGNEVVLREWGNHERFRIQEVIFKDGSSQLYLTRNHQVNAQQRDAYKEQGQLINTLMKVNRDFFKELESLQNADRATLDRMEQSLNDTMSRYEKDLTDMRRPFYENENGEKRTTPLEVPAELKSKEVVLGKAIAIYKNQLDLVVKVKEGARLDLKEAKKNFVEQSDILDFLETRVERAEVWARGHAETHVLNFDQTRNVQGYRINPETGLVMLDSVFGTTQIDMATGRVIMYHGNIPLPRAHHMTLEELAAIHDAMVKVGAPAVSRDRSNSDRSYIGIIGGTREEALNRLNIPLLPSSTPNSNPE